MPHDGSSAPWDDPPESADGPATDLRAEAELRWRLVLGRHAEEPLPMDAADGEPANGEDQRLDQALDFLYDRSFADRAHQPVGDAQGQGLTVHRWLHQVRELFPEEACRVLERDALHRYGLTELVTDPEVLAEAEPTPELLGAILTFKDQMPPAVLEQARRIVRQVIAKLRMELELQCLPALTGGRIDPRVPPARTYRNIDWHGTIRRNLDRWDVERQRLVPDRMRFHHRQRGRSPWTIVLAVDQSGSMVDSLIHTAILGAILAGLPAVQVHLVLWDHRVIDMSDQVQDPLEVLMATQLGGGTKLAPALRHCAGLVRDPRRTALVVLSDFVLFGDGAESLRLAAELHEAGVRGLGLLALDEIGRPQYDEAFARQLADTGWSVAALTPKKLAELLGPMLRS
jgi:hypothetical protein